MHAGRNDSLAEGENGKGPERMGNGLPLLVQGPVVVFLLLAAMNRNAINILSSNTILIGVAGYI